MSLVEEGTKRRRNRSDPTTSGQNFTKNHAVPQRQRDACSGAVKTWNSSVFAKTEPQRFKTAISADFPRVPIEDFRGFWQNRQILASSGSGFEPLSLCLWLKTGRNRREISPIRRFQDKSSPKITWLRKDRGTRAPQLSKAEISLFLQRHRDRAPKT